VVVPSATHEVSAVVGAPSEVPVYPDSPIASITVPAADGTRREPCSMIVQRTTFVAVLYAAAAIAAPEGMANGKIYSTDPVGPTDPHTRPGVRSL
jgi:hypothetical protein